MWIEVTYPSECDPLLQADSPDDLTDGMTEVAKALSVMSGNGS